MQEEETEKLINGEEPIKKEEKRNPDGTFAPGTSGGPGRPPGKTLKEFARDFYMKMTEEEKIAYLKKVEEKKPGFAWSMAEGNPHQSSDTEHKGTIRIGFDPHFNNDVPDTPPQATADRTEQS